MIQLLPVSGMGEVLPGADVAAELLGALDRCALRLEAGDILVITQKIVSKAEDRFAALGAVRPGARALELAEVTGKDARLVEVVLSESDGVVRAARNVLITRHRLGLVMANAGIDQSNIGPGSEDRVLLLPIDPDGSAQAIAQAVREATGRAHAVVISDSFGRPWRHGVVNVAIGAAGLASLADFRGQADRDGRVLQVTQIALADMVASAAGLVSGEAAEGVPAVVVRGLRIDAPERPAGALVRPAAEDLFR